ncbi:MAG: PEP/pyruvate-binding domain-containing protein [Elusimicrobiota bacterium]
MGLPTIPQDAVMGQAAVEKFFSAAVRRALIRGELKWNDKAVPQRRDYHPVEALATYVQAHRDDAEATASVLGHFESELEYEPIGAVGAMRADRAIWQFGEQALVVYGLREPETGTLGYAAVFRHDPAGLTKLDVEGLASFLRERDFKAPAPEALTGAQKTMLKDWQLRGPSARSPLSGTRIDGLAASAGQGGLVTASVTFDRKGKPGAALIVPYTTPDDIDAIKNAAAVVTTGGGLLSHAAITTRELGLASVILPRAEWKQTADGKDELELTTYEPEGEPVRVAGTVVRPRLKAVRLSLREGDLVRVNGATGEMYLFPKSSESRKAGAVAFAVEEALFNPAKRASAGAVISKLLNSPRADMRRQAQEHGRRLFEDRLSKVKSGAPAESEAGAASISAFHSEIKQLEDMAALFALKTDSLASLKADEQRLRKALINREEAALIAARPEVVRLNSTKPTTTDLPAVRRLVRLLQNRPVADKVYAKSTLDIFSSLEKKLTEEKQRSIKDMAPSVLPLGVVDDDYRILVGGKLSKLGEILAVVRQAGGYVPEALAVTTEAYRRFLKENKLDRKLRSLAEQLDDVLSSAQSEQARHEKVAELSQRIRALLLTGKLDPRSGVGKEIWEGMQARGLAADGKQLAIRSSAVQEDTADAAFAGAAESYLHVRPEEALNKVIENWTSFWLPRGIVYRHQQKIPSTSLAASTIIQEMAEADVAGVLFTQNPVTGADEFVINAAYGLGEGIVSGIVQTDRYVARKSDGQETKLPFIGDKRVAVMPKSGGSGTELQGVSAERRKRRALSSEQTQRLTLIAKALEAHFGYPLDIEFAVKGDRIAILQARPVTTRGQTQTSPPAEEKPLAVKVPPVEAPAENIAAPAKKKIVFVCAGNACRSPMAEFFAKDMLAKEGNATVEVFSRGVHARDDGYMSPDSQYQLQLAGIDGRSHRSFKLRAEDVGNADYILAMDQGNVDDILKKFPGAAGKTHLLKEFARTGTGDVENPWPAIGRAYEETAVEIAAAVDEVARSIQSGERKLKSIVFACSFNTSRSPMAEYFAKEELKRLGINNVKVISRSLYAKAHIGKPMNWKAQELLEKLEIDGSKHKSTPLTQQEAKDADAILVMDYDNLDDIAKRFPETRGKAFLLKQFAKTGTAEIENPSKKIFRAYDKAGKEIKQAVEGMLQTIEEESRETRSEDSGKKRITFVGAGYTDRSRVAEQAANEFLARKGDASIEIVSRGVHRSYGGVDDEDGYPFALDISEGSRKSSGPGGLTAADVRRSDVILAMDDRDLEDILRKFPQAESKTFVLKEFAGIAEDGAGERGHESGARFQAYQETAKEITAAVKAVVSAAKSGVKPLKSILFACTHNTSRSPMAEYYAREELKREGMTGVKVVSRRVGSFYGAPMGSVRSVPSYGMFGTYESGSPMKQEALLNLEENGIDGKEHRATTITKEDVDASDVILVMEEDNVKDVLARFPEAKDKVHLLKEYAGTGIGEIENPSKSAPRIAERMAGDGIKTAVAAILKDGSLKPAPDPLAVPEGKKRVLFVCAANHSRSPLAERILQDRLRGAGITNIEVGSRGLGAWSGGSMNSLSHDVLDERGIKHDAHYARALTRGDVRRASLLLVMEQYQKAEIENRFPQAKGKVFLLTEYGGQKGPIIDKPHTIEVFRHIADQMEDSMDGIVARLKP